MATTRSTDVLSEKNKRNIQKDMQTTPLKAGLQPEVMSPMQTTPAKPGGTSDVPMTPGDAVMSSENVENSPGLTPVMKLNESVKSEGSSSARRRSKRFSTPKTKTPSGASPSKSATKRKAEENEETSSALHGIKAKRLRMADHIRSTNLCPLFTSPVVWTQDCGSDATDLFLDANSMMVSTRNGAVIEMDLKGQVQRVLQLPLPATKIIQDGPFMYAWCPAKYGFQKWKGALFGLNESTPRLLFEVADIGDWMVNAAAQNGLLVLADDRGCIFVLGCDGNLLWEVTGNDGAGKMLLTDQRYIYAGHRRKITKYCLKTGRILWTYEVTGRAVAVHTGVQDEDNIYVEVGSRVLQLTKDKGTLVQEFTPVRHRASGVCIGNGLLVTGSCPTVLFDINTGEERFRMNFSGRLEDSVVRMHPTGTLFAAWDKIYAIDITPAGLQRAIEGKSIPTKEMTINTSNKPSSVNCEIVTMTTEAGDCVILECVEKNGNVEVVATSGDYEEWSVRFPKALKIPGKKYIVDKLIPHKDYKFYGTLGDIRELVKEIPTFVERGINTSSYEDPNDISMDRSMNVSFVSRSEDVINEANADHNGNISTMDDN